MKCLPWIDIKKKKKWNFQHFHILSQKNLLFFEFHFPKFSNFSESCGYPFLLFQIKRYDFYCSFYGFCRWINKFKKKLEIGKHNREWKNNSEAVTGSCIFRIWKCGNNKKKRGGEIIFLRIFFIFVKICEQYRTTINSFVLLFFF